MRRLLYNLVFLKNKNPIIHYTICTLMEIPFRRRNLINISHNFLVNIGTITKIFLPKQGTNIFFYVRLSSNIGHHTGFFFFEECIFIHISITIMLKKRRIWCAFCYLDSYPKFLNLSLKMRRLQKKIFGTWINN